MHYQEPEAILKQFAHQYGITILAQPRLKGLILDMMPTAERKHINVLKRAIDEQIGVRLLEMQHDDPSVRQIKVNTLKEKFKNDNAFDDTAYYIVDCFVHALKWNNPEPEIILPLKEIKIGNQIWANRNLDVSYFRSGAPIPEARNNEEWKAAGENEQPAWCYYDNDPENGKIYGKLYNWFAVNDHRGLTPAGWHIPSDVEWSNLTEFLGGEEISGEKLKSKKGWHQNGNGSDDFSFKALPGGGRYFSGSFCNDGYKCNWWSATDYHATAWYRIIHYDNSALHRSYFNKELGFSVRCLRDNPIACIIAWKTKNEKGFFFGTEDVELYNKKDKYVVQVTEEKYKALPEPGGLVYVPIEALR